MRSQHADGSVTIRLYAGHSLIGVLEFTSALRAIVKRLLYLFAFSIVPTSVYVLAPPNSLWKASTECQTVVKETR